MKIIHEREKCIGCGACVALCPEIFEMTEDGKASLKKGKKNEVTGNFEKELAGLSCSQEAVDACPVEIIRIITEEKA